MNNGGLNDKGILYQSLVDYTFVVKLITIRLIHYKLTINRREPEMIIYLHDTTTIPKYI